MLNSLISFFQQMEVHIFLLFLYIINVIALSVSRFIYIMVPENRYNRVLKWLGLIVSVLSIINAFLMFYILCFNMLASKEITAAIFFGLTKFGFFYVKFGFSSLHMLILLIIRLILLFWIFYRFFRDELKSHFKVFFALTNTIDLWATFFSLVFLYLY